MSISFNKIAIPIDPADVIFWSAKYPDCADVFDGNDLVLAIAPAGYRPIWEDVSGSLKGITNTIIDVSDHRLEGFILELAEECNCATVYYALKELEKSLKASAGCGLYPGLEIRDYINPEVEDIRAGAEFTTRTVSLEIENAQGTGGEGVLRSAFGVRIVCNIIY